MCIGACTCSCGCKCKCDNVRSHVHVCVAPSIFVGSWPMAGMLWWLLIAGNITIMGGKSFRKVAAAARLKKRDLKKADKMARTYDQTLFTLDGCMDLDLSFGSKTMCTPVYIKADSH